MSMYPGYEEDLREIADRNKSQVAEQIERRKAEAREIATQQQQETAEQYQQAQRSEAVKTQKSKRNFAEYLANVGNTSSGAGAEAEIRMQTGYLGRTGELERDKQKTFDQINRTRELTIKGLSQDMADAYSTIESDYLRDIMTAKAMRYQAEQEALAKAQAEASRGGRQVVQEEKITYNPLDGQDDRPNYTGYINTETGQLAQMAELAPYGLSGTQGGGGSQQTTQNVIPVDNRPVAEKYNLESILKSADGPVSSKALEDKVKNGEIVVVGYDQDNKLVFDKPSSSKASLSLKPSRAMQDFNKSITQSIRNMFK